MPAGIQGAGGSVAACREIAKQYHNKIIEEFGDRARTRGYLVVAAIWYSAKEEFFISSLPYEANFIPDA